MKFKKALVMGTGRLPFQCALRLGGFFDQADICVLEIKLTEVSVLEKLCMNHQISYACLSKTQIEERLRGISEPTLVVSAVNTYLFQPWFLQQEHITTINYHNALLPRHRGRNAESWAIFDGDEETGITCWGGSDPVTLPDGTKYADFCKAANARGELPEHVTIVRIHRTNRPGERSINATQANGFDTLTPEGVLGAEASLRGQIDQIIRFLRQYVPGFAGCELKGSGSALGVRETRRIMGDYVISDHDVETGARQADVVVHDAWFLIDIHNPAGGGQAEGRSQPAIPYDIPYRSLLPRGLDNLLTAGRCISGTHRAHASYRIGGVCLATGQAAGVAAALAALGHVAPRELEVKKVQDALARQGAVLFDQ